MTRHLRPGRSETEPVSGGRTNPNGPTKDTAATEPDDQNPWPAIDSADSGDAAEDLDAEIGAAAKALFLAPDLVRPGPGPLPFGAKARDRRERRREVDSLAAARRDELEKLLTARRNGRSAQAAPRIGGGGRPRVVAILLISVVIIVAVVGWWMSLATSPTTPAVGSADTGSVATDPPGAGSLWIISPNATGTVAAVPDLIWPEGAATSWLAAWCSFEPTANPDAAEQRIREAMTSAGWERFSATRGQFLIADAPGMTVSCDEPVARVVSRPPGDATVVVVLVSATRTITDRERDQAVPDRKAAVRRPRSGRTVAGRCRCGRWLMVLSLAGRGLLARRSGVKAVLLLGGSGTGLLVAGVVLILVLAVGLGDGAETPTTTSGDGGCPIGTTCGGEVFDPGNIISDNEFYNSTAMTEPQIRGLHPTTGRRLYQPELPPRGPGDDARSAR